MFVCACACEGWEITEWWTIRSPSDHLINTAPIHQFYSREREREIGRRVFGQCAQGHFQFLSTVQSEGIYRRREAHARSYLKVTVTSDPWRCCSACRSFLTPPQTILQSTNTLYWSLLLSSLHLFLLSSSSSGAAALFVIPARVRGWCHRCHGDDSDAEGTTFTRLGGMMLRLDDEKV